MLGAATGRPCDDGGRRSFQQRASYPRGGYAVPGSIPWLAVLLAGLTVLLSEQKEDGFLWLRRRLGL